jgi:hypothetical protein
MSGSGLGALGFDAWPLHRIPYLIFYEIAEDEVIVVGIRHGTRRPGSMPGGDG